MHQNGNQKNIDKQPIILLDWKGNQYTQPLHNYCVGYTQLIHNNKSYYKGVGQGGHPWWKTDDSVLLPHKAIEGNAGRGQCTHLFAQQREGILRFTVELCAVHVGVFRHRSESSSLYPVGICKQIKKELTKCVMHPKRIPSAIRPKPSLDSLPIRLY